jgi:hypothetical protein
MHKHHIKLEYLVSFCGFRQIQQIRDALVVLLLPLHRSCACITNDFFSTDGDDEDETRVPLGMFIRRCAPPDKEIAPFGKAEVRVHFGVAVVFMSSDVPDGSWAACRCSLLLPDSPEHFDDAGKIVFG